MIHRPLDGIVVVALEQAVSGPLCTARMVDAGARVIKVERPTGDFARGYDRAGLGDSSYFAWTNHGKESIVLDLKTDDDPVTAHVQRIRSSIFVKSPDYGTRSSTVITISHDQQVRFVEHSFDIDGKCQNVVNVEFELQ